MHVARAPRSRSALDTPARTHLQAAKLLLGLSLLVLGSSTSTACAVDPEPSPSPPRLQLAACAGIPDARCGTFRVFENRDAAAGREIELNVVILDPPCDVAEAAEGEAACPEVRPDPVVFLAGGPGAAATDFAPFYTGSPMRQTRSLIFVDQRGTGKSNGLQCDFDGLQEVLDGGLLFEIPNTEACRARLSEHADLRYYTTDLAMDDLDDLRAELGHAQLNLLGGSYGTRAALVYLRRHGNQARSAILRGVATTAFNIPPDLTGSLHSVRDLFDDCSVETTCDALLPEPEQVLLEVLASVRETPLAIELEDPSDGGRVTVTLRDQHVSEMVRLLLYDSASAAYLPALLAPARDGDLEPLANVGAQAISNLLPSLSIGMFLSVVCAEDVPFLPSDEEIAADFEGNPFQPTARVAALREICVDWPRAEVPASFKQHVESAVPTLLLSGAVDPVTPPASAEAALAHLSNALHLVLPETGHSPMSPGCVEDLQQRFLDTASVQGLNAACVADLARPPFELE